MDQPLRIFIDDIRNPPEEGGWTVVRSSQSAILLLERLSRGEAEVVEVRNMGGELIMSYPGRAEFVAPHIDAISFDHDLGGDDTTRPVMMWLVEHDVWPEMLIVHSSNPVGRAYLLGTADSYGPTEMMIPQLANRYPYS